MVPGYAMAPDSGYVSGSFVRVPTGQGKLEKVGEFVWSGKNIIFEMSGIMQTADLCDFLCVSKY